MTCTVCGAPCPECAEQTRKNRLTNEARMIETLTPAELDVLHHTSHGLTAKQIATQRNTSPSTIKRQRKTLLTKLDCTSITGAAGMYGRTLNERNNSFRVTT